DLTSGFAEGILFKKEHHLTTGIYLKLNASDSVNDFHCIKMNFKDIPFSHVTRKPGLDVKVAECKGTSSRTPETPLANVLVSSIIPSAALILIITTLISCYCWRRSRNVSRSRDTESTVYATVTHGVRHEAPSGQIETNVDAMMNLSPPPLPLHPPPPRQHMAHGAEQQISKRVEHWHNFLTK
ncbi:hypothetical protein BgiMline_036398, partial [Biomphalaria glabrata]